jgi:general secretion pathway protein L
MESMLRSAAESFVDEVTAILETKRNPGRRHLQYTLVERGDDFECYRNNRGGPSLVAKGSLDRLGKARLPRKVRTEPIEFRLDGSRVLTKVMQFPAASRGYLDAIVAHQLDRATPWTSDRVVFDYAIADDEPAAEGQIAVRLVATSRDVFDRSMSRLAEARIKAVVVGTTEDPIDRPSVVNLLHSDRAERRAALRRKVGVGLLAFLLIGAGLSALTGWRLYALQAEAAGLQEETDAARASIESARAGTALAASRERLVAAKRGAIPIVLLLDKLSSIIPTNTYLTALSVEDGEVRIAGLTSDAPALIGILEAADILSGVRFVAPTMRDEGATPDRFEIAAAIVPGTAVD